ALAVSAHGDTYGTLYVAQGGDPTDPDSRPVVAAYREIDPGPSQRPASVASHPARTTWGVVVLGGGVVLLGAWRLVARKRRQSRGPAYAAADLSGCRSTTIFPTRDMHAASPPGKPQIGKPPMGCLHECD